MTMTHYRVKSDDFEEPLKTPLWNSGNSFLKAIEFISKNCDKPKRKSVRSEKYLTHDRSKSSHLSRI